MKYSIFSRSLTHTAICAFLLLVLLQATGRAELLDRVVAVVNDDIITLSELESAGKEFLARIEQSTPADQRDQVLKEARERILNSLIDQRLLAQQAANAKIQLSDAEFEESYTRNLQKTGLSRQQLIERLRQSGLSEEKYKEDMRNQLLRDKLILYEVRSKIVVTDEMIRQHFDKEYGQELGDGSYYLQQIGFSWGETEQIKNSPGLLMADKARARQEAFEARQQLVDGADFATVARQKSDLPSAADGGDIGAFHKDDMALPMQEAVVQLAPGEITPVIEMGDSFQIFKLLSRQEGELVDKVPFDTVKEEIRKKLFESKFDTEFKKWVDEIKKGAYVKRML